MRTEQELIIDKSLFSLIDKAGNNIVVDFISREKLCRDNRLESDSSVAYRVDGKVILILIEPSCPLDLDEWGEAIVKAEELLEMIELEMSHECNNPNFFKATVSKFRYINKQWISNG